MVERNKDITDDDRKSMRHLYEEIIDLRTSTQEDTLLESIAATYGCSVVAVEEAITQLPWLRPSKSTSDLGKARRGAAWWESTHNDPLELVKLYYPHCLPAKVSPEISTSEAKPTIAIDASAYLEKNFGPEYMSDSNVKIVDDVVEDIITRLKEAHEEDVTADLVKHLLDQRLTWAN